MAVYHFHAKYRNDRHDTCSVDGLIDVDEEPAPNSKWLDDLRSSLAVAIGENVRAESVQIRSLTRISG